MSGIFRQEGKGKLFRNSRERLGQLFAPQNDVAAAVSLPRRFSAHTHTPGFRVKVRQQRRRGKKIGKWGARYIFSPPQNGGRKLTNKDFLEGLSISPLGYVRHWNGNDSRKRIFELGTRVAIARTNQRKKAGYYV